ncbi:MAG TPA: tetratricopeptide repeat protein [Bacteroidia bacterium]|nr:tetratricopeptide repeat protein [Bacteroidia bacterium]
MRSVSKLQYIIVAVSILLFVLLFIANKKPEKKADDAQMPGKPEAGKVADIKTFADAQISIMPDSLKKTFGNLEKNAKDTTGLNALIDFFNKYAMPVPAAYYYQKKSELLNTAKSWCDAGNRYFYAVRFVRDKNQVAALYQNAMSCYRKSLQKDPANTNAKIQLASCYVEGSTEPMTGITMLKELEKTDSSNIQVQMVLGGFAVKSGQMDKAEARYLKVLKLKPDYLEAYLFLADVYEKKGDKNKTIETLEKYLALTPDKEIREEIKKYIEQLKKTNV